MQIDNCGDCTLMYLDIRTLPGSLSRGLALRRSDPENSNLRVSFGPTDPQPTKINGSGIHLCYLEVSIEAGMLEIWA